jgi:hypothetical protein
MLPTRTQVAHDVANAQKKEGYIDPDTGLFVMTAGYLKNRGYCCGKGCRHCPFPAAEQRRAGRIVITGS